MKRYIKASAMKKSDLAGDIEEKTIPVMNALAQLYYFPNNENKNHWRQEVWANFHRISRLKRTNKLPSFDFIMLNTFECNKDQLKVVKRFVISKESKYEPDPDRLNNDSMFKDLVQDYFEWLASKFSQVVQISNDEIYQKLEELGL